jgi:heptosyltransferase-3
LNVREGIAALQKCALFLGNDTGTMHMAVAAGIPCVAIFSSRDYPGNWYPYGNNHIVFRTPIDCEGCMLERCIERKMECILSIDEDQVYAAAQKMLGSSRSISGSANPRG